MNDTDIRQSDIDSAAAVLTGSVNHTPQQWREFSARTHGRTSDVYARCAELAEARQELAAL